MQEEEILDGSFPKPSIIEDGDLLVSVKEKVVFFVGRRVLNESVPFTSGCGGELVVHIGGLQLFSVPLVCR